MRSRTSWTTGACSSPHLRRADRARTRSSADGPPKFTRAVDSESAGLGPTRLTDKVILLSFGARCLTRSRPVATSPRSRRISTSAIRPFAPGAAKSSLTPGSCPGRPASNWSPHVDGSPYPRLKLPSTAELLEDAQPGGHAIRDESSSTSRTRTPRHPAVEANTALSNPALPMKVAPSICRICAVSPTASRSIGPPWTAPSRCPTTTAAPKTSTPAPKDHEKDARTRRIQLLRTASFCPDCYPASPPTTNQSRPFDTHPSLAADGTRRRSHAGHGSVEDDVLLHERLVLER